MSAGEFAWAPPSEFAARTHIEHFISEHGLDGFGELRQRAVADPDWFWDSVVTFLGIPFAEPYTKVLDESNGIEWATWFIDGRLNFAAVCVDRWVETDGDREAVVWEGEDGDVRSWDYNQLRAQADGLALTLASRGIEEGDVVGIFMPMLPETVATVMAVAKLGAVFLPLFSGYGVDAVVTRLADAEARALVTADGFYRRGNGVDMWAVADAAASAVPSVHTVVVVPRLGRVVEAGGGRNVSWPEPAGGPHYPTRMVDSEHPLFVAYTSGTTGRPKGSVHVHGGWTVKVAQEGAFQTDIHSGDRLFWFTDMGWVMGPWEITAALSLGATVALYEGAPDHPSPDRLWSYVERHGVTHLGISPTLVRSIVPYGDALVKARDLSSLRVLASTGEPWNEAPWRWYFDVVGDGRCPVINISGGTEVGACFLSPHPDQPIKPVSVGGPSLGMAVEIFDEAGTPVVGPGVVGELVCTKPWPGMTRGLYKDPERYLETYWSTFPGVWRHGDWASYDEDGAWFLHGRSDDTIKVAGKRLGPAEVESAIVSHPAVTEAAAVGLPDEVKGEALGVVVVLAPGTVESEALRDELKRVVADQLGKPFQPDVVRFADALPKTRNAKVLRRAVRSVLTGREPGDLSSLEDPATIDAVRGAR
jgi:acetyl-CoA synthetase